MTELQATNTITAEQCRMARSALNWTMNDLAAAADVGRATIHRFENGGEIKPATIAKLRGAFVRA